MKNSKKPKYLGKKTVLNQNNPDKFNDLAKRLTARRDSKDSKEMEWLEIAEKAESLER